MRGQRIDRVEIAGAQEATTVTIPWASRGVLLQRLRSEGGADDAIRAFEAVGSSRPVRLDRTGKRRLLVTCSRWLTEPGGVKALPEGILDLRKALEAEKANGELDPGGPLKSAAPRADTNSGA